MSSPVHPAEVRNSPPCSVPDCVRPAAGAGLCTLHHARNRKGQPLVAEWETTRASGHGFRGFSLRTWEKIQCHECGKWFKSLSVHLKLVHGLSTGEYRAAHDLPATGLVGEATREKISRKSKERMESDQWQRFVEARDNPENVAARMAASKASPPRGGTRRLISAKSNGRPRIDRFCSVCGKLLDRDETRHWQRGTCSEACWHWTKRVAAQRRAAERMGESADFQRIPAPAGAVAVFPEMIPERTGIPWNRWQDGVKRGRFPKCHGRQGWMPFWWSTEIEKFRTDETVRGGSDAADQGADA